MTYNAFDVDSESAIDELNDIDPDLCYFNQITANMNCEYYSENTFRKKVLNLNYHAESHLSIIHSNIRSFHANGNDFCNFVKLCNHEFSIICFSETWLNYSNNHLAFIPNYTHISRYRTDKPGGGVSIFVSDQLKLTSTRDDISSISNSFEAVFIEIDKSCINADRNIIIGCIYRPPKSPIHEFNEALRIVLSKLSKEDKHIYLTGDYNINLLNSDSHIPTAEFIELLFTFSYFPCINKPTRISSTSATIIDNIFVNNIHSKIMTAGILATDVSDHCPVFCITPFRLNAVKSDNYVVKRIFNDRNKTKFMGKLSDCDWTECLRQTDCQTAFSMFYNQYVSHFDECFPLKKIKVGYKNRKPWLSDDLKQSIKRKNALYRKFLKSKKSSDKQNYIEYKRHLRAALRRAERAHYDQLFAQYKDNLRKSWGVIKEVINQKQHAKNSAFSINVAGTETSDPAIITKTFNEYFVNVGPSLAQSIPTSSTAPTSFIESSSPASMYISPVTEVEISNLIRDLRNSSPGSDGIPPAIIKETADILIPVLVHVINLSLSQGVFPHEMKVAKVVPLFKTGDKSCVNNYRPISLLPCLSKILEKCMSTRLMDFISKHNILYKYQFGFRSKHSTNIALNLLVDKITNSLDRNEVFVGISIDFRKAFDTIDFHILLDKLYTYGVRGNIHKWFSDYLTNRKQFVELGAIKSPLLQIQCGVPQGSILGPILFILYINDLPLSSELLPIIYADDTNLFLGGRDPVGVVQSINRELIKISDWITCNRLSLNVDKTNFIVFSRTKYQDNLPPLCINGSPIRRVNSVKFLGVIIDDKLSWKDHINHIKGKVSKSIGMLSCARRNLDCITLKRLYFAFVHPYLNYCLDVWGRCSQQYFISLFRLQKRAIRTITFSDRRAHSAPLFQSLEIPSLESMYILSVSIFMYKFYHRLLPPVVDELFQFNSAVHSVNTRQRCLLHVPITRSKYGKQSIRFRGVQIFNQIPQHVDINTVTLNQFRSGMRRRLINESLTIQLNPVQ